MRCRRSLRQIVEQLEARQLLAGNVSTFALAASDYAAVEANNAVGTGDLVDVVVVRNGDQTSFQTVYLDTPQANGTATPFSDYSPLHGLPVDFAPGQRAAVVTVEVLADFAPESDETVALRLYDQQVPPAGMSPLASSTVTIYDDDANQPSVVRFAASNFAEPEYQFPPQFQGVKFVRTGNAQDQVSVTLTAQPPAPPPPGHPPAVGAPTSNDFVGFTDQVITFDPSQTRTGIFIPFWNDGEQEIDEVIPLVLNLNPQSIDSVPITSGLAILDDDGGAALPRLSFPDLSIVEGNPPSTGTPVSLPLTLSRPVDYYVTLQFASYPGGTADPSNDFTPSSGQIEIAPGQTSVNVPVSFINPDTFGEPDETFNVAFFNPSNGVLLTRSEATVTIIDDEPSLSIGDASAFEGNSGQSFIDVPVTLSQPLSFGVTANVTVVDAQAPNQAQFDDYVLQTSFLSFAAGETSKTVRIVVNGDQQVEPDEIVALELYNQTFPVGLKDARGIVTIKDDDGPPIVSIDDGVTVTEGNFSDAPNPEAVFTVRLDRPAQNFLVVNLDALPGTAQAGFDYGFFPSQVFFQPGQTTATAPVQISPDRDPESDETFTLRVLPGSGYNVASAPAGAAESTATIVDDDGGGHFFVSTNVRSGSGEFEGRTVHVTINRDYTDQAATVTYATANGAATAGSDYTAKSGTLSFAPGEFFKTVDVPLLDDTATESDETFTFNLTGTSTHASVEPTGGTTTITILDTDGAARFRVLPLIGSVNEGPASSSRYAEFEVRFQGSFSGSPAATVQYATANGTAKAGEDFQSTSGTLSFSTGNAIQTVRVPILDDGMYEGATPEAFTLNLSNATRATINTAQASATVVDDDPMIGRITFAQSAYSFGESAGPATVTVNFTPTPVAPGVTVNRPATVKAKWSSDPLGNVTHPATAASDFNATSGTLTFATGTASSQNVSAAILSDGTAEFDEQFKFSLVWVTGDAFPPNLAFGQSGYGDTTTVTIVDDDRAPRVTAMWVSSSGWTTSFKNFLQTSGKGNSTYGFAITPGAPTDELPWTNLDRISVRFNQNVNVNQAALALRGLNIANYTASGFTYDASSFTATWNFATPFANERLQGTLNNVTSTQFGDAMATGTNTFLLDVLPGDVNRSGGSVTGSDVTLVRNAQNFSPGSSGYDIFKDVNGTGSILGSDVTLVRNRQGFSLPIGTFSTVSSIKRITSTPMRAMDLEAILKSRPIH